MIAEGGVSTIDGQSGVRCRLTGRGLVAKPGGTFAGTPEQIRQSYTESGSPSPVWVEYRLIPGVAPPSAGAIPWVAPYHVEVRYSSIQINYQSNWANVAYYASGSCQVGEQMFGPTPVLNGDKGNTGNRFTSNWVASLSATPGDTLTCGMQGHFVGALRDGAMPGATMQPGMQITSPGTFTSAFNGSNGDTNYTVTATIAVTPGE